MFLEFVELIVLGFLVSLVILLELLVVDEGISLAPTYSLIAIRKSDLRSSLCTKCLVKLFLSFFGKYVFIEWKVI